MLALLGGVTFDSGLTGVGTNVPGAESTGTETFVGDGVIGAIGV